MTKNPAEITAVKSRDGLFDNIRCLLIFLVVFAHMFSPVSHQNTAAQLIYKFIFLFHMPAFILISGYFSKNVEKCRENAVAKFLLPYCILNLLSSAINLYKSGKSWHLLDLFYPRWGIWFLLVLFVYRLLLKDLVRVRYILPISFLIGLISGCFEAFDSDLALGRIFGFLPFFMLGYFLTPEHIEKIRKIPKWIPLFALAASVGFILFAHYNYKLEWTEFLCFPHQMLFLRNSYHECKLSITEGLIARTAIYLFALAIIFALIALMPRKQTKLTTIGKNTMTVYVLHLFLLPHIKDLDLFGSSGWDYIIFSFIFSVIITLLFSAPPVAKAYDFIMGKIENLIFRKQ